MYAETVFAKTSLLAKRVFTSGGAVGGGRSQLPTRPAPVRGTGSLYTMFFVVGRLAVRRRQRLASSGQGSQAREIFGSHTPPSFAEEG